MALGSAQGVEQFAHEGEVGAVIDDELGPQVGQCQREARLWSLSDDDLQEPRRRCSPSGPAQVAAYPVGCGIYPR